MHSSVKRGIVGSTPTEVDLYVSFLILKKRDNQCKKYTKYYLTKKNKKLDLTGLDPVTIGS